MSPKAGLVKSRWLSGQRQLSLAERRAEESRRLRRARHVQKIWAFGDRVTFELVEHLIAQFDLDQREVGNILTRFASIDPVALKVVGADKLPPPTLSRYCRRVVIYAETGTTALVLRRAISGVPRRLDTAPLGAAEPDASRAGEPPPGVGQRTI